MKNLIVIALLIFTAACADKQAAREKNVQRALIDSLSAALSQKDSAMSGLLHSFRSLREIIDSINASQQYLADFMDSGPEEILGKPEMFRKRISGLNHFLKEKRQEIRKLNFCLTASGKANKELAELITLLNDQLQQKSEQNEILQQRITMLSAQLSARRKLTDSLRMVQDDKDERILELAAWLKTGYYASGTAEQLAQAGIVQIKKGKTELRKDFEPEAFERVEFDALRRLSMNCKNASILSAHPPESYTLANKKGESLTQLVINDPDKFWSKSKFLVIVTN